MPVTAAQKHQIQELSESSYTTKRATVPALEEILYEPIKLLDHGFVRVIDYMGDDNAITQAARVSYGRGTKQISEDRGLIRYLMRHWHSTPFEMCEIKLHVKLPIFVARQWIRHRTANVNEYSARYSILDREFYLPDATHLAAQSASNRQGRGDVLTGAEAKRVMDLLRNDSESCYEHYMEMLNLDDNDQPLDASKSGLARELARMNLTLNYYTQWYWKIDLHNLMHFVMLRADPHAQYEIRVYADAILEIMKKWVPHSFEAFMDYRMNSVSLSSQMKGAIKRMLSGEKVSQENSGLTKREWEEMVGKMGLAA
ncbi:MAG: FAD-dependent thymidylate synthase [Candidatus Jidaibacter sp.]|jgi:thymidylate synthase (FAD)|nr:FAD-dependent thymidylate synthase [Candidatus Jidaibacter sp.]